MKHNKTQRRHIRDARFYYLGVKRAFLNASALPWYRRFWLGIKLILGVKIGTQNN